MIWKSGRLDNYIVFFLFLFLSDKSGLFLPLFVLPILIFVSLLCFLPNQIPLGYITLSFSFAIFAIFLKCSIRSGFSNMSSFLLSLIFFFVFSVALIPILALLMFFLPCSDILPIL